VIARKRFQRHEIRRFWPGTTSTSKTTPPCGLKQVSSRVDSDSADAKQSMGRMSSWQTGMSELQAELRRTWRSSHPTHMSVHEQNPSLATPTNFINGSVDHCRAECQNMSDHGWIRSSNTNTASRHMSIICRSGRFASGGEPDSFRSRPPLRLTALGAVEYEGLKALTLRSIEIVYLLACS
jgi:hypothetical protein